MYGILMAFQDFKMGEIPGFSQWVGFKQFSYLFKDPKFWPVVTNTIAISLLKLLINFTVPIVFAVIFNEVRSMKFKKVTQTITYLPHFLSWVVTATLMFDFLSLDNGAFNNMMKAAHLITQPIGFFQNAKYFWMMAVWTDLWKELGWSTIIFIAAMASIDAEIYEAAEIDGASRLQKMWYITIQSIKPVILLLFIFTVGGLLNANFDQIMNLTNQMTNAMLMAKANVIDTYVYVMGLNQMRYSFAAAASLLKNVINFALLLSANRIVLKLGETPAF